MDISGKLLVEAESQVLQQWKDGWKGNEQGYWLRGQLLVYRKNDHTGDAWGSNPWPGRVQKTRARSPVGGAVIL